MLKKVVITNCFGECMEYAIDGVQAENPSGLIITSIDGLGPVKADINMMDLATTDGQLYNSARLSGRNIVIKALFTHASSIEEARLLSYKYFPIKKKLKFHIETDNRIGEVEGYVESNEPDIFSDQSGCQISILCENAYFDGGEVKYVFGETIPQFKFAFGNESLDDKLIKMSEYATEKNTRTLIYDGDADAGMEIEVSAPTDDIMDTFNITGIEVTCNDEKIGIDTSKMVTQVPDTSPKYVSLGHCFWGLDETRYKYLCESPFEGIRTLVFFKGKLMCFDDHVVFTSRQITRYAYDFEKRKWDKLSVIGNRPFDTLKWIGVFKDGVYAVCENTYLISIYKYNEITNEWDVKTNIDPSPGTATVYKDTMAVVYRDEIHIFCSYKLNPTAQTPDAYSARHYGYYENSGGSGNVYEISDPRGDLTNEYFNLIDNTHTKLLIYNDYIHIIASGNKSSSQGIAKYHIIWNGDNPNEWTKYLNKLPGFIKSAVVFNNKIHGFIQENEAYSYTNHYILNDDMTWTNLNYSPCYIDIASSLVSDDDRMYLATYDHNGKMYNEPANNDHLIENDRLVINTNKGKKSVYLYRNDNKYNVINALDKESGWPQLHRGANHVTYNTETGFDDTQLTITANKWYEGV